MPKSQAPLSSLLVALANGDAQANAALQEEERRREEQERARNAERQRSHAAANKKKAKFASALLDEHQPRRHGADHMTVPILGQNVVFESSSASASSNTTAASVKPYNSNGGADDAEVEALAVAAAAPAPLSRVKARLQERDSIGKMRGNANAAVLGAQEVENEDLFGRLKFQRSTIEDDALEALVDNLLGDSRRIASIRAKAERPEDNEYHNVLSPEQAEGKVHHSPRPAMSWDRPKGSAATDADAEGADTADTADTADGAEDADAGLGAGADNGYGYGYDESDSGYDERALLQALAEGRAEEKAAAREASSIIRVSEAVENGPSTHHGLFGHRASHVGQRNRRFSQDEAANATALMPVSVDAAQLLAHGNLIQGVNAYKEPASKPKVAPQERLLSGSARLLMEYFTPYLQDEDLIVTDIRVQLERIPLAVVNQDHGILIAELCEESLDELVDNPKILISYGSQLLRFRQMLAELMASKLRFDLDQGLTLFDSINAVLCLERLSPEDSRELIAACKEHRVVKERRDLLKLFANQYPHLRVMCPQEGDFKKQHSFLSDNFHLQPIKRRPQPSANTNSSVSALVRPLSLTNLLGEEDDNSDLASLLLRYQEQDQDSESEAGNDNGTGTGAGSSSGRGAGAGAGAVAMAVFGDDEESATRQIGRMIQTQSVEAVYGDSNPSLQGDLWLGNCQRLKGLNSRNQGPYLFASMPLLPANASRLDWARIISLARYLNHSFQPSFGNCRVYVPNEGVALEEQAIVYQMPDRQEDERVVHGYGGFADMDKAKAKTPIDVESVKETVEELVRAALEADARAQAEAQGKGKGKGKSAANKTNAQIPAKQGKPEALVAALEQGVVNAKALAAMAQSKAPVLAVDADVSSEYRRRPITDPNAAAVAARAQARKTQARAKAQAQVQAQVQAQRAGNGNGTVAHVSAYLSEEERLRRAFNGAPSNQRQGGHGGHGGNVSANGNRRPASPRMAGPQQLSRNGRPRAPEPRYERNPYYEGMPEALQMVDDLVLPQAQGQGQSQGQGNTLNPQARQSAALRRQEQAAAMRRQMAQGGRAQASMSATAPNQLQGSQDFQGSQGAQGFQGRPGQGYGQASRNQGPMGAPNGRRPVRPQGQQGAQGYQGQYGPVGAGGRSQQAMPHNGRANMNANSASAAASRAYGNSNSNSNGNGAPVRGDIYYTGNANGVVPNRRNAVNPAISASQRTRATAMGNASEPMAMRETGRGYSANANASANTTGQRRPYPAPHQAPRSAQSPQRVRAQGYGQPQYPAQGTRPMMTSGASLLESTSRGGYDDDDESLYVVNVAAAYSGDDGYDGYESYDSYRADSYADDADNYHETAADMHSARTSTRDYDGLYYQGDHDGHDDYENHASREDRDLRAANRAANRDAERVGRGAREDYAEHEDAEHQRELAQVRAALSQSGDDGALDDDSSIFGDDQLQIMPASSYGEDGYDAEAAEEARSGGVIASALSNLVARHSGSNSRDGNRDGRNNSENRDERASSRRDTKGSASAPAPASSLSLAYDNEDEDDAQDRGRGAGAAYDDYDAADSAGIDADDIELEITPAATYRGLAPAPKPQPKLSPEVERLVAEANRVVRVDTYGATGSVMLDVADHDNNGAYDSDSDRDRDDNHSSGAGAAKHIAMLQEQATSPRHGPILRGSQRQAFEAARAREQQSTATQLRGSRAVASLTRTAMHKGHSR